jgi:malic enzyme
MLSKAAKASADSRVVCEPGVTCSLSGTQADSGTPCADQPLSDTELALRDAVLDRHRAPTPGKTSITPTKPVPNRHDLPRACLLGVACACLDVMVGLDVKPAYVFVCDSNGVVREGRGDKLDAGKQRCCHKTDTRTLANVVNGAEVFLGCLAAGVLTVEVVKTIAYKPVILALANREPEIRPEPARRARPDCTISIGRSDDANQVNNVMGLPHIFRGALDWGATWINEAMKLAFLLEIAALAKAETSAEEAGA